jgi:hypothetical protein
MTQLYDLTKLKQITADAKAAGHIWLAVADPRGHNVMLEPMDVEACREWCEANCQGSFELISLIHSNGLGIGIFQNQRDATLFKLFFG